VALQRNSEKDLQEIVWHSPPIDFQGKKPCRVSLSLLQRYRARERDRERERGRGLFSRYGEPALGCSGSSGGVCCVCTVSAASLPSRIILDRALVFLDGLLRNVYEICVCQTHLQISYQNSVYQP
jgi:hypothetical protein